MPSANNELIFNTEIALEDARRNLRITMKAARACAEAGIPTYGLHKRYLDELQEVVRLEQYGQDLDATNQFFWSQGADQ
jgi:hypothetical protein